MSEITLLNYGETEKGKEPVVATLKDDRQKTNEVTITSLEIAELTGKRHDHILRDIEEILGKIRDVPKFGEIYKDARNRQQKCYRLPKIEALILISGYSVELREKIILRVGARFVG